jgi:hypothetical protein
MLYTYSSINFLRIAMLPDRNSRKTARNEIVHDMFRVCQERLARLFYLTARLADGPKLGTSGGRAYLLNTPGKENEPEKITKEKSL